MGCDIHVHVEVCRDGKWVHVGSDRAPDNHPLRRTYNADDGGGAYLAWPKGTPYEEQKHDFDVLGHRNYALFALLAGVRNHSRSELRITKDAPRRAIPRDSSSETRAEYNRWEGDAHTPSWVTLEEILAFDWDLPIPESGIVHYKQYLEWKQEKKEPNSWCQGTSAPVVDNNEIDRLVAKGTPEAAMSNLNTPLVWHVTARSFGKWFLNCCEGPLRKLADDPRHVRLVFWFDN